MKRPVYVLIALILISSFLVAGCGTSTSPSATQAQPPANSSVATQTKPAGNTATASPTQPATSAVSSSVPATKPSVTTPASGTPTPQTGGTLRVLESNFPGDTIGWMATGTVWTAQWPAMEVCIAEQINGDFVPQLATSWDVVNDPANPSITLHLRKNVKFHDGTDFNAQAMKWNLEQVKAGGLANASSSYWKSFDILDDYTLRINLPFWANLSVRSLTNLPGTAVSPTAFQKNGLQYMQTHMIGTGAFKQTDYQKDVVISFAKNPDYWDKGKPYLDGIQMLYVSDALTRIASFQSGGADVMNIYSNPRQGLELQKAGYKVLVRPLGPDILSPDSANPDSPWANQKVREAAEYAIDKQALSTALGFGFRPPAYQFAAPVDKAYLTNLAERKYNVAKAKQLLTEAGYPSGFKTSLIAQTSANRDTLVAIQANLASVGIQAEMQIMEPAKYMSTWTGGWKNGVLYNETITYPIFNAIMNNYFGPNSVTQKSTQRPDGFAALFNNSVSTPAPDVAAMQKMNQALYDNCTVIPIFYGATMYVTTNKVYDTGLLTRGSTTQWNPFNGWLSK